MFWATMLLGAGLLCGASELVARRVDSGGFLMLKDAVEHHRQRPNLDVQTSWGGIPYRLVTNSLGWRDSEPGHVVSKLSDRRRRIVFLGDSFTDGVGYDYDHTFVGKIARKLDAAGANIEVLHGGTVSFAPILEYLRLKRFLENGYHANAVVLLPDPSDVTDEIVYGRGYSVDAAGAPVRNAGIQFQNPLLWLLNSSALVRASVRGIDFVPGAARLRSLVSFSSAAADRTAAETAEAAAKSRSAPETITVDMRNYWAEDPAILNSWAQDGLTALEANVGRIRDLCRTNGIELLMVFYPHPPELYVRDDPAYYETLRRHFPELYAARERYLGRAPNATPSIWQQRMNRMCEQQGLDCFDLHDQFLGVERWHDLFIADDVHLSEAGHQLVAEALAPELLRRNGEGH